MMSMSVSIFLSDSFSKDQNVISGNHFPTFRKSYDNLEKWFWGHFVKFSLSFCPTKSC